MTQPGEARVRIGKVRLKGGAQLLRLPEPDAHEQDRRAIHGLVDDTIDCLIPDCGPGLGGFAVVMWAEDGTLACVYRCWRGRIVSAVVPDAARAVLTDALHDNWSRG